MPSHVSSTSQSPAEGRQTVPASRTGCAQTPPPSHSSRVQASPSSAQGVPAGSLQVLPSSSQSSAHSPPPVHGSPAWVQTPPWQVSAPLQNRPSSQPVPFATDVQSVVLVCASQAWHGFAGFAWPSA
jgi:hypothetical protein